MVMRSGAVLWVFPPIQSTSYAFSDQLYQRYCDVSDPVFDTYYPKAMAATTTDGMKQILIDANKYVAQQHFVISLMLPMNEVLYQPWIYGYNGQAVRSPGNGTTFQHQLLRGAILDGSKLKKSLGH